MNMRQLSSVFYRNLSRTSMAATTCTSTSSKKITQENVVEFLTSFDTVLTDCDGVLWNGPEALEGAPEAFDKLKRLGKRIFPVTNNSTKSRSEYVTKCHHLGFPVEKEEIIGSAYVAAQYLKYDLKYKGKVFMLGSPGLYSELTDAGYEVITLGQGLDVDTNNALSNYTELAKMELDPEVKCVVVGFDAYVNYIKLALACSYINVPGAIFMATNTDAALPMGDGKILPGTGSIVSAVITAAGRQPDVICGKPHQPIYDVAHEKHDVNKERTIMIGDRLNTDILLAYNCGLRSLHVHTGVHKEADVKRLQDDRLIPHYYIESLGHLGALITDNVSDTCRQSLTSDMTNGPGDTVKV